jgi:hypothetical protein
VRLLFDRGTILLRDLDSGFDPSEIPGVLWDARVRAYRMPAYRYQALRGELLRRAVPFADEIPVQQPLLGSWSPIELRPYQDAALWAWELAQRRALIVLPTGSGKTRLALAAMARMGSSVLCLVPTRVLLAQWLNQITHVYAGPVGCYGDGAQDLAGVTVATFESAYRHMDRLGNRFRLLVVDEAHHFGYGSASPCRARAQQRSGGWPFTSSPAIGAAPVSPRFRRAARGRRSSSKQRVRRRSLRSW